MLLLRGIEHEVVVHVVHQHLDDLLATAFVLSETNETISVVVLLDENAQVDVVLQVDVEVMHCLVNHRYTLHHFLQVKLEFYALRKLLHFYLRQGAEAKFIDLDLALLNDSISVFLFQFAHLFFVLDNLRGFGESLLLKLQVLLVDLLDSLVVLIQPTPVLAIVHQQLFLKFFWRFVSVNMVVDLSLAALCYSLAILLNRHH